MPSRSNHRAKPVPANRLYHLRVIGRGWFYLSTVEMTSRPKSRPMPVVRQR